MNRGTLAIVYVAILAVVIGTHVLPKHTTRTRGSTIEAMLPASTGPQKERLALELLPIGEQR